MRIRTWVTYMLFAFLIGDPAIGEESQRLLEVEFRDPTAESDSVSARFVFSAKIAGLDVRTTDDSIVVRIEGGLDMTDPPAGMRVEVGDTHTDLILEARAARLTGVALDGAWLEVRYRTGFAALAEGFAYSVGPGDELAIAVYREDDLTGEYTVAPDGTITMPWLQIVAVAGLTEGEIVDDLTRRLAKDFLVDPEVSVTVSAYQSQFAYITGAGNRAARVPLRAGMTINDVLSEAGVALLPGQDIVLDRTGTDQDSFVVESADVDARESMLVRDGDVLKVQEPNYVYIQGEVRRPGRYALRPGMTLLLAIPEAEGLTDWANRKAVRIRSREGGETTESKVNLRNVEDRDDPDPELRPGDLIVVKRRAL